VPLTCLLIGHDLDEENAYGSCTIEGRISAALLHDLNKDDGQGLFAGFGLPSHKPKFKAQSRGAFFSTVQK